MQANNNMEYRYLGNSGLRVSAISFGFADARDQDLLNQLLQRAIELGINFFDCAETYGNPRGSVEKLFGNALKTLKVDRSDLVITTKIFWGGDAPQVNRRGLSRKHLIEGTKASLKRMQVNHVDVLLAHRYDPNTPMEEICRAFDWLVRHGYTHYWGVSEWPAQKIEQAIRLCDQLRLHRPITEQPEYSMLVRERFEKEYYFLFRDYKFGSTIWSPLAGGVLTGKYNTEIPEGSRVNTSSLAFLVDKFLKPENIEGTRKITLALEKLAQELGTTSAKLALAWTLRNKDVSTAIIGARRISQLEENVKAIEDIKKITPEVEEQIEKILNNQPDLEFDARMAKKVPSRRHA